MWDERYQQDIPTYGEAANDFLVEHAAFLRPGTCLCLAEGQGRNAVWIAQQGFAVTAMDQSPVGMAKARALASALGVPLTTAVGDLANFDLGTDKWDNIVSIFGHLPGALRHDVHRRVIEALRPGGIFLIEAFTPEQLATDGTGGPSDPDMLLTIDKLTSELAGLEVLFAREIVRPVNEGDYHQGDCAVVQFIARKGAGV